MDLSNLLNNQKETRLSITDLRQLLEAKDIAQTLDKIQSSTAFDFPTDKNETFVFFDIFIQLVLSVSQEDDPYSGQYAKSIVIDSLRSFINGMVRQNGIEWVIEFPLHFSQKTWRLMHTNITISVYLYGLVLALWSKPEIGHLKGLWVKGVLEFIRSNSPAIMLHLWLDCCCVLDDYLPGSMQQVGDTYLQILEHGLSNGTAYKEAVMDMLGLLRDVNAEYLAMQIDQQLGNALARPAFTKDDMIVGRLCLANSLRDHQNQYRVLFELYHTFQSEVVSEPSHTRPNPLLSHELLTNIPSDKYIQADSIRKATLSWIKLMSSVTPKEFDAYLDSAIDTHYPTDTKTIFDLTLADWTARDRFHRHLGFIIDCILQKLRKSKYNRRASPYYAFVRLFDIPDDHHEQYQEQQGGDTTEMAGSNSIHSTSYQARSGAYIDLSQFSNCSDVALMNGCCSILQKLTQSGMANDNVDLWVADCLQSSSTSIVENYTQWLANKLCTELRAKQQPQHYRRFMQVLLKNTHSKAAHVVPILLEAFSDIELKWLLKENKTCAAPSLLAYFDDGSQISKDVVIQNLFKTKSKHYMDMLLKYLREQMPGTDPKLPRSRAWFKNHFLRNLLSLVGEDVEGNSVTSCIFRQLLKTRGDFEWYFATSLGPSQQVSFKSLDLASSHDIYSIKNTGLAAMLQEMVHLTDNAKKEQLINVWFDLWTSPKGNGSEQRKFNVPVSWILLCAGLYNQAPVLVKQMVRRFVKIGIQQNQTPTEEQDIMQLVPERSFLERMMDLILLSDVPEPDSLFELVLDVFYNEEKSDSFVEVNWAIINVMIELSEELEVEMASLASKDNPPMPPPPPSQQQQRQQQHKISKKKAYRKQRMSRLKLDAIMKEHERQLDIYFKKKENASKVNNQVKGLTTLVQRVFNFLLRLLNNTSSLANADSSSNCVLIKQDIQLELTKTILFYEPLAKLAKLIRQPVDLYEDIQTTVELSVECLKKETDDPLLYEASQKILGYQPL